MKILIACEYSGITRDAFIKQGHDAVSCDLEPSESPFGEHYQADVFEVLDNEHFDAMIAFPPCTNISSANAHNWIVKMLDGRMDDGLEMVRKLLFDYPHIKQIALENPVGAINTRLKWGEGKIGKKPDQIYQPWQFGEPTYKRSCLWLKNFPALIPTELVPEHLRHHSLQNLGQSKNRGKLRSKQFVKVANAMAEQWTAWDYKEQKYYFKRCNNVYNNNS